MGTVTIARLLPSYLLLVVYLCLYPWNFNWDLAGEAWSWRVLPGYAGYVDVILNLCLLAPAGLCCGLMWRGKWPWLIVPLAALFFSALIEWLQVYLPTRDSSAWDVLYNVVGAALGLALGAVAAPAWRAHHRQSSHRLEDPSTIWLLALFLLAQWFPFIPRIRLAQLREVLRALGDSPDLLTMVSAFFSWLAASVILGYLAERRLTLGFAPAILLLVLLGRTLFPAGTHSGLGMIASTAGIFVGSFLPWRVSRQWLGLAMLGFLAFRQLYPFDFEGESQEVMWIPFDSILQLRTEQGLRILWEKSFVYASTIWLLAKGPWGLAKSTAMCAGVLAAGEFAQRWIPGRTPDTLDVLIVMVAGLGLAGSSLNYGRAGTNSRGRELKTGEV